MFSSTRDARHSGHSPPSASTVFTNAALLHGKAQDGQFAHSSATTRRPLATHMGTSAWHVLQVRSYAPPVVSQNGHADTGSVVSSAFGSGLRAIVSTLRLYASPISALRVGAISFCAK